MLINIFLKKFAASKKHKQERKKNYLMLAPAYEDEKKEK
jgi:hypothetical protein